MEKAAPPLKLLDLKPESAVKGGNFFRCAYFGTPWGDASGVDVTRDVGAPIGFGRGRAHGCIVETFLPFLFVAV